MNYFRKVVRKGHVDRTSNNLVDKEVQSMLFPLNMMQYILFCPKYRIKNNRIIPNNLTFNCISVLVTITILFFTICRYSKLLIYKELFTSFMIIMVYFDSVYYGFGFIMNFVLAIIHAKKAIQFVLIFQRIHRFLHDEKSFKKFTFWNWIVVSLAWSYYAFIFTYFCAHFSFLDLIICGYFLIVFDFNIVYAYRIIKLLQDKIVLWKFCLLNNQGDLEHMHKMFQAYVDILKCYDMYKACFQLFIFYYMMEILVHALVYTQLLIDVSRIVSKGGNFGSITLSYLSVLCWIIKDFMWLTALIQQCERFYLSVESILDSCSICLKTTCSDAKKKLCKNVLRLHRASFSKIRVCGLFYLDVALQLSLMTLVTNNVIVLLQFAYL